MFQFASVPPFAIKLKLSNKNETKRTTANGTIGWNMQWMEYARKSMRGRGFKRICIALDVPRCSHEQLDNADGIDANGRLGLAVLLG